MGMGYRAAVLAAALTATAGTLGAQTLPALQLGTRNNTTVGSDALPSTGQWLLVYVVPGSAPSDRLVQALGESWTPDKAARIVFIVAANAEQAQAYFAAKGGQALGGGAVWYTDADNTAWAALGFQGTLGVAGVVGSMIDWKIDGVIQDPSVVAPVVNAWLASGARPSGE